MIASLASPKSITELRALVERETRAGPVLPFGLPSMDDRLAGGGLNCHALHDVAPARPSLSDDAAAALFTAGIVGRHAGEGGTVLWALSHFDLFAPGLEQAGLPSRQVLYAQGRDDAEVLALVEDGLNHGSLAAVVGEVRRADLKATRRLQLAAERGRTPVYLIRRWRRQGVCPLSDTSAASTRWRVASAPSGLLRVPGVGRSRWALEVVRQRGAPGFSIHVEVCDDQQGRLALPAAAPHRAAEPGRAVAQAA